MPGSGWKPGDSTHAHAGSTQPRVAHRKVVMSGKHSNFDAGKLIVDAAQQQVCCWPAGRIQIGNLHSVATPLGRREPMAEPTQCSLNLGLVNACVFLQ